MIRLGRQADIVGLALNANDRTRYFTVAGVFEGPGHVFRRRRTDDWDSEEKRFVGHWKQSHRVARVQIDPSQIASGAVGDETQLAFIRRLRIVKSKCADISAKKFAIDVCNANKVKLALLFSPVDRSLYHASLYFAVTDKWDTGRRRKLEVEPWTFYLNFGKGPIRHSPRLDIRGALCSSRRRCETEWNENRISEQVWTAYPIPADIFRYRTRNWAGPKCEKADRN